jgi:hypothetical protein
MTTATKTFLAVSVIGFAAGGAVDFSGPDVNPMLTAILPIGAIFLGVFLISLILEKEVALYDKEQELKLALVRERQPAQKKTNAA